MVEPAPELLVSDYGGYVETLAIAFPHPLATTYDHPKRLPLGNLVAAMPKDVTIVVLCRREDTERTSLWLGGLAKQATTQIVAVDADAALKFDYAMWVQDPLLVSQTGDPMRLLEVAAERPQATARWLAEPQGWTWDGKSIYLPGGNLLVGRDYRIVGADCINAELFGKYAPGSLEHVLEKHAQFATGRFCQYGYPDPAYRLWSREWAAALRSRYEDARQQARYHASVQGTLPSRLQEALRALSQLFRGRVGPKRQLQVPFHLDLWLALTGCRTVADEPIVMLARPVNGDVPEAPPALIDGLDQTAEQLRGQGLRVLRNPIPWKRLKGGGGHVARNYNNVIVENALRPGRDRPVVFLPHFADREPELAAFDAHTGQCWSALGFEVIPVNGWTETAFAAGALRCASKVLRRSRYTEPERVIAEAELGELPV